MHTQAHNQLLTRIEAWRRPRAEQALDPASSLEPLHLCPVPAPISRLTAFVWLVGTRAHPTPHLMSTSWFRNRMESGLENMLQEEGSGNQLLFLPSILRPPCPSVRSDKDFALVIGFRSHPVLDPRQLASCLLTPGLGAELWPEGVSSKERECVWVFQTHCSDCWSPPSETQDCKAIL